MEPERWGPCVAFRYADTRNTALSSPHDYDNMNESMNANEDGLRALAIVFVGVV
jgi:hypothetical protein